MKRCKIKGCSKPQHGQGLCNKHYRRWYRHGHTGITREYHGGRSTKEYHIWADIKQRCNNPNRSKDYKYYGGRGIKVCDSWLNSFTKFFADMGKLPKGYQIDRIDNNGDYEPKNCHWVTPTEQARNKSNIVLSLEIAKNIREMRRAGLRICEIAKKTGQKRHSVYYVINGGWSNVKEDLNL